MSDVKTWEFCLLGEIYWIPDGDIHPGRRLGATPCSSRFSGVVKTLETQVCLIKLPPLDPGGSWLGTGWGALSFIQGIIDESEVDLTVVSPRSFFFYTPLLAGSATGTVSHYSIMEPIRWHTSRFGLG